MIQMKRKLATFGIFQLEAIFIKFNSTFRFAICGFFMNLQTQKVYIRVDGNK